MHEDQTQSQAKTPKERWLASINFEYSPFDFPSADGPEDTKLHKYFLAKDDPEEREDRAQVLSDLDDERSSITFADSGCGKSAYRMFFGRRCAESGKLALQYTDFSRVIEAPSLDRHCDEILRLSAAGLLKWLGGKYSDKRSELRPATRLYLDWLMQEYTDLSSHETERNSAIPFGTVDPEDIRRQELLSVAKSRLHELKMTEARLGYETPAHILTEIDDISLRIAKLEAASIRHAVVKLMTPFEKLRHLREVCSELGLGAIFVLVELVDPYPYSGWTSRIQTNLIESLVTHPKLLENLNLKLFLPTELRPLLETTYTASIGTEASLDSRWVLNELSWTDDQIKRLLVLRLGKASDQRHESFKSLIEWRSSPLDVDQLIISAARNNPRRLIRLCQQLFDQHWKAHPHQAMLLEEEAIDAIRRFH